MTVGEAVNALVREHGKSTLGLYILESALKRAVGKDGRQLLVDGQLVCDSAVYQQFEQAERAMIAEMLGK